MPVQINLKNWSFLVQNFTAATTTATAMLAKNCYYLCQVVPYYSTKLEILNLEVVPC